MVLRKSKQGEGESWSDDKLGAPRYFCYWTKDSIKPLIQQAGFKNIQIVVGDNDSATKWLQIITKVN